MKLLKDLIYSSFRAMCWLVGIWPSWMLYPCLGGLLYFLLYRVVGYRRTVVAENLANAFPEKTPQERKEIERRFYRHLAEIFVDDVKQSAISRKSILKRVTYSNITEHELAVKGKNWIMAMSHFGSWELPSNLALLTDHRMLPVYRPLSSWLVDRYFYFIRSRFKCIPVPMNGILREVIDAQDPQKKRLLVVLIGDQSPPVHEIKHWFNFLNQETAFFSGMDKMALRFGMPVSLLHMRRSKPLCYEATFIPLYDGVEQVDEYEITRRYVEALERMIREAPHMWMWSHRRWKHTPESVAAYRERTAKA